MLTVEELKDFCSYTHDFFITMGHDVDNQHIDYLNYSDIVVFKLADIAEGPAKKDLIKRVWEKVYLSQFIDQVFLTLLSKTKCSVNFSREHIVITKDNKTKEFIVQDSLNEAKIKAIRYLM